ncbi:MAG: hypothetical protein FWB73_00900 [Treponema sp.]|nr:hypothetical protein [Treponema sp.]
MANNLEKSQKYLDLILELFKKGSLTARLDSESMQYDNSDAKTVKVLTVETTGLGNYVKDQGYPQGAITTAWTPFELNQDRGAKFLLDRIDDDEVLGLTIGRAAQEFTDFQMVPELDAYRFAKYFDGAGKKLTANLNRENILEAFDAAAVYLNSLDVPETSRILYVNQNLELATRAALNRVYANEGTINTRVTNYNGMEIIYVPNKRFQTLIELNSGANDQWGYKVDANSKSINFILMYTRAVVQASKTAKGKFISADENPNVDSHQFAFRIFHDAFVIDKLKDGVYAHTAE